MLSKELPVILLVQADVLTIISLHLGTIEVIIAMDNDDAGNKAASSLAHTLLSEYGNFSIATLPKGMDPADAGKEVMTDVLKNRYNISSLRDLLYLTNTWEELSAD